MQDIPFLLDCKQHSFVFHTIGPADLHLILYVCSQILCVLEPHSILAVYSEILCCNVGPHLLSRCILGHSGNTDFIL
jgi:hypothetical protein